MTIDNVAELYEKGDYFYLLDSNTIILYVVRSGYVHTIELVPA